MSFLIKAYNEDDVLVQVFRSTQMLFKITPAPQVLVKFYPVGIQGPKGDAGASGSSGIATGKKAGLVDGAAFTGSPKKSTVVFTTPYSSMAYVITFGGNMDRVPKYESKSVSGFVINLQADEAPVGEVSWETQTVGESP